MTIGLSRFDLLFRPCCAIPTSEIQDRLIWVRLWLTNFDPNLLTFFLFWIGTVTVRCSTSGKINPNHLCRMTVTDCMIIRHWLKPHFIFYDSIYIHLNHFISISKSSSQVYRKIISRKSFIGKNEWWKLKLEKLFLASSCFEGHQCWYFSNNQLRRLTLNQGTVIHHWLFLTSIYLWLWLSRFFYFCLDLTNIKADTNSLVIIAINGIKWKFLSIKSSSWSHLIDIGAKQRSEF